MKRQIGFSLFFFVCCLISVSQFHQELLIALWGLGFRLSSRKITFRSITYFVNHVHRNKTMLQCTLLFNSGK